MVRRAAEIAERRGLSPDGMTLSGEELEERASSLGIAPEAVRAAVTQAELESDPGTPARGPLEIDVQLDGAVSDEEMVAALRDETGKSGDVERVGDGWTWRPYLSYPRRGARQLEVRVKRVDGVTHVRVYEPLWPAKVIGWVAIALPIALSLGVNGLIHPLLAGKPWLAVALVSAAMALATVAGFVGSTLFGRHRARTARRIAGRLVRDFPEAHGERIGLRVSSPAEVDADSDALEASAQAPRRAGRS